MNFRVHFVVVVLLLLSLRGFGQDSRATIEGTVKEASGASVVGATVTAVNTATNVKISALVNEAGVFEIPYLLPGTYDVSAEASGFKSYLRRGLELRIADRAELDIVLQVGQVSQTITVSGATSLLEVELASTGTIIDKRSLVDEPVSGGNADTMAMLSPGVTDLAIANHPYEIEPAFVVSRISVSGMRSQNTEYTVDGSPVMSDDSANYIPPVDLIQETKVETNSFDAGYGHSVGGYINTVTRSGTNALHGSLYEFHSDASLMGINLFQRNELNNPETGPPTAAKLKSIKGGSVSNRFGGSIGGPLVIPKIYDGRNKTFWIFGYEGFHNPTTDANSGSYFTVPTSAERNGDFSALLALGPAYQIYDPATIAPVGNGLYSRQPFPGNIIPPARLDPAAQAYLKYYPLPNNSATVTAAGLNNYFHPVKGIENYYETTARFDENFSEKHRIFGRVNYGQSSGGDLNSFANVATNYFNYTASTGAAIDDVYVFSPTLLMDVRYGFTRYNPTAKLGPIDLTSLGLPSTLVNQIPEIGRTFPQLLIDGGAITETSANPPLIGPVTNYHVASLDLTRFLGRHTLRLGGDFRVYMANSETLANSSPYFTFGSVYTNGPLSTAAAAPIGQGLASFMLGIPTGGSIVANTSYAFASKYTSGYVQDDFRATSKLTLNLGVRYEYETAPAERHNRTIEGFDSTATSPISSTALTNYAAHPIPQIPAGQFKVNGGLTFAGVGGDSRGLWQSDSNNIAPRLGIAFQLDSKTVIRSGYGLFYMPKGVDRIGTAADRWAVNQLGFNQTTALVPSLNNGETFIASLENPFPNGIQQPVGAAGGLSTGLGQSIMFYNPHQVNPLAQRWTFGFQRELPSHILMEVTYNGTSGSSLGVTRQIDAIPAEYLSTSPKRNQTTINTLTAAVPNPFYPLLPGTSLAGTTVATSQLLMPYPEFTSITYNQPIGRSIYHGAYVRVERRFSSGIGILGSYTFSKYLQTTEFLNPSDENPTHVISDQDIPERFSVSGLYDIPVGRGRRFGNNLNGFERAIAGGWQISMIWMAQSGTPLGFGNPIFNGNVANITLPNNKKSVQEWFNVNAGFDRNPSDQLADNIQSFPLRLPGVRTQGMSDVNDSAMKYFRLSEGARLQIRCEMMNAFNRSEFQPPNTTVTSSLFGQVSAVESVARQIFFAAKIVF